MTRFASRLGPRPAEISVFQVLLMKTIPALLVLCLSISSTSATLIITGVVDGTQSGGNPKALEFVSTMDGLELSDYFILRDTNGTNGGPFSVSSSLQLPEGTLDAGEFFYVYGNTDSQDFLSSVGIGVPDTNAILNNIANQNGDDIFALSTSLDVADIVDAFGLLGQGQSSFADNSIAYRQPNTPANATGVEDAGNFDITPYSDAAIQSTFGTYAVPEPTTALLGGLGFLLLLRRRR